MRFKEAAPRYHFPAKLILICLFNILTLIVFTRRVTLLNFYFFIVFTFFLKILNSFACFHVSCESIVSCERCSTVLTDVSLLPRKSLLSKLFLSIFVIIVYVSM